MIQGVCHGIAHRTEFVTEYYFQPKMFRSFSVKFLSPGVTIHREKLPYLLKLHWFVSQTYFAIAI